MKNFAVVFTLLVLSISLNAQTSRTWTGSTSTDWNTAGNWSPSGVPSTSDHIVLNNGSLTNMPLMDASHSITNISVSAGTLNLNGYTLTITGTTSLTGGTINNGTASFSNTTTTLAGTTFGAKVSINSANISFNGSTFNSKVTAIKTGSTGNLSNGGNTFNDTLDIRLQSGSGGIIMYNYGNTDAYNGNILVSNASTATLQFGYLGTATLASGKTITVGIGGFASGGLALNNMTQSGTTAQSITLTGTAAIVMSGSSWAGKMTMTAPRLYDVRSTTFADSAIFYKNGSYNDTWAGGNTFNAPFIFNQTGGNTYLGHSASNSYNGNVILSNTSGLIYLTDATSTSTLASGKTVTVGTGGFSVGTLNLNYLTQSGTTAQTITLTGSATLSLAGSSWGGKMTLTAPRFDIRTSTFSDSVTVNKNGSYNDTWSGGNTFNSGFVFNQTTGSTALTDLATNYYNGNVILNNSGTGIDFSVRGGISYLGSGKTITIGSNGFTAGTLYLKYISQSAATAQQVTLTGTATLDIQHSTWAGKLKLTAPKFSIGTTSFADSVIINKNGNYSDTWYGGNTFNSTLVINQTAGGTSLTDLSANYFNGDVVLNNSGSYIEFSIRGGISYLASGKTIAIGTSGFTAGTLYLKYISQSGSTAQSLTLTGPAGVTVDNSTFNGAFTLSAPNMVLNTTTYNSTVSITKTGSSSNISNGGNTYNGNVTFTNTGTGYLSLATQGFDNYNASATFTKSGSGDIIIAGGTYYGANFKGDVTLNNISSTQFGSSQMATFSGTAAQTLSQSGGTLSFAKVTINKASNSLTLGSPLAITNALTLTSGTILTTSTNLLNFADNATVSSASNSSYVQGPVTKTGNDAFTFPTGKSSVYRPIGITAPSSTATVFTAEYKDANQTLGSTADTSIANLSTCEHWTLTRSGSSSNVNVTLGWNSTTCNSAYANNMRVAGWNGSSWINYGNSSHTGNATIGTVTSNTNPTAYNAFALSNKVCTAAVSISASGATTFCSGGSVTLTANANNKYYAWNTSASTQAITVNTSGTYTVNVRDTSGCNAGTNQVVTVNPSPIASVGVDTVIVVGDTIQLATNVTSGTSAFTYAWTPSTGLSSNTVANPFAHPDTLTDYIVTVTDAHGCTDKDTIRIWAGRLSFTMSTDTANVGDTVVFTNTSTGFPSGTLFDFDFGAICGNSPNSKNPCIQVINLSEIFAYRYFKSGSLETKISWRDKYNSVVLKLVECARLCDTLGCDAICNGGYEDYSGTSDNNNFTNNIDLTCSWQALRGTPDFFHVDHQHGACDSNGDWDAEAPNTYATNSLGFNNSSGYIGILTYSEVESDEGGPSEDEREYVFQKFKDPLAVGIPYTIKFKAKRNHPGSLCGIGNPFDKSNQWQFATKIGAVLSEDMNWPQNINIGLNNSGYDPIDIASGSSAIKINSTSIITDDGNWTNIEKTLTPTVSYKYITIGRFGNDNDVDNQRTFNSDTDLGYYLIDDVSIVPDLTGTQILYVDNTSPCVGDNITFTVDDRFHVIIWYKDSVSNTWQLNGSTLTYTVDSNEPFTIGIKVSLNGCVTTREITITPKGKCCLDATYAFFDLTDGNMNASQVLSDIVFTPQITGNNFTTGYDRCGTSVSGYVGITGTFEIDTDFEFEDADVRMSPNARILVKSGKILTITDSWLHECNGELWNRIEVEPGAELIITSAAASSYDCGSLIEDATKAVDVHGSGELTSENFTTFNKNLNHLTFTGNSSTSTSSVKQTKMECAGVLLSPKAGGNTINAVVIDNCTQMYFGDYSSSSMRNYIQDCFTGIFIKNSSVDVFNNVFDNINCGTGLNGFSCDRHKFPIGIDALNNVSNLTTTFTLNIGDASNKRNWFTDVENGIRATGGFNVNIKHNTLSNVFRFGMILSFNRRNNTLTINNNTINDVRLVGILANRNHQHSLAIYDNTIDNSTIDFGTAIFVDDDRTLFAPSNTAIFNNTISSVFKGISLSSSNNALIYNNTVGTTLASGSDAQGITVRYCHKASIQENTIVGNGMDLAASGIKLEIADRTTVSCNSITNTGCGIGAWGDCSLSTVASNEMEANFFGVLLAQNGIISPQGPGACGTAPPNMNSWIGPDFIAGHLFTYFSQGSQSGFTFRSVDAGTDYHPTGMIVARSPNNAQSSLISICTTSASIPTYATGCTESTDDNGEIHKIKLRITDGDTTFIVYPTESEWLMRHTLLDRIDGDSLLMLNDTLVEFVAYNDTTQLGQLHKTAKYIYDGNKTAADSVHSLLTDTSRIFGMYADYYKIYIENIMGADSTDTLSARVLGHLRGIADECPYQYGPVVWQARNLYKLYSGDTTDITNECEYVVLPDTSHMRLANVVENATNPLVNVYPNPTSGNINIVIDAIAEDIVIEVYSSTGQLIESRKVSNSQTIEVPLGRQAIGIYTVRVILNGKHSQLFKVIKAE